jgi:phosphate-selective porin
LPRAGVLLACLLVLLLAATPGTGAEGDPPVAPDEAGSAEPGSSAGEAADAPAESGGDADGDGDGEDEKKKKKGTPVTAYYKKGLYIETENNRFKGRIRWRVQMRATDLSSNDLVGEEDGVEEEAGFRIRRARFKFDGHAYAPWLQYYLEYGIAGNILLTWQFDVARLDEASMRVGQWKVVYNRERVDSSGKQQFVDRSIVNNPFTIDRQQGIALSGRLFDGKRGDSRYAVGVFTGTGRGGSLDEDGRPMYTGRWQWNFMKRDVSFTQSDVKYTPKTIGSLAVAGAHNIGQFTRWSSSGGGQLPGFDPGAPGQYKTEQWMAEFALKRKGLSVQSEYHFKRVEDRVNITVTELDGGYAQVGYFFHAAAEKFPKKLEFAARYARVEARQESTAIPADRETTLAANYFFSGHDNKLSADVSQLRSRISGGSGDEGWRVRLQWDISF